MCIWERERDRERNTKRSTEVVYAWQSSTGICTLGDVNSKALVRERSLKLTLRSCMCLFIKNEKPAGPTN